MVPPSPASYPCAMASLDPLLRAVVEHGMDSLVLEPGHLPRLRRNGHERSVTKTRLDGDLIRRLAAEVADGPVPDPGRDPEGAEAWEFEYRLDGTPFHFAGRPGRRGWTLEARPSPHPESSPPTHRDHLFRRPACGHTP